MRSCLDDLVQGLRDGLGDVLDRGHGMPSIALAFDRPSLPTGPSVVGIDAVDVASLCCNRRICRDLTTAGNIVDLLFC